MGNTATANLLVVAPPTVTIGFSPSTIALNANSTLSFTITNPNTGSSLSNVGFTYSLPTGVALAASPNIMGACGSASLAASPGGASISLSSGTLTASPAAGSSCTVSVSVTGTTAGSKSTSLMSVTSTEGGTGGPSNTATLTVAAPPSISASFSPSPINVNQTSTLTFTIVNPSANTVSLTGVGFIDTLNTGLTLVSSTTSVCNGGTLMLTSPNSIVLSGVTIPVSGQCQFGVVVTGATANTYTNTTGAVASGNGGTGNTATANLTVNGADLTIAKSHTGNFTQGDTGDTYTITVSNVGSGPTDGSTVTVSDTLPAGLTPTGPTGSVSGWSCGIASQTVTCTRNDVLAINNAYPSITVTVNVAANAAPLVTNTATVAGGADINLNNNSASNPTTIIQVVKITVAANLSGPTVTVDNGTPFTGSQTFTWVVSSSHTIATTTPQSGGTGIQYAWQNWSDSGALSHSVTTPSTATTYTANFQTQYLLTTAVSPSGEGTISPATGYVNANSVVPVSASANPTYVFTGFSGGLTGATNPQNLNMTGPMTVTANFETGPNPAIAEVYNSNFRQGDAGDTYTITVTNVGQAPTVGTLQWMDTLPTGLTAIGLSGPSGWTCTLSALTCSTSNALTGSASAMFTLTVDVAANAAASVTNVATVSGGGGVILTNNTASLVTPIVQVADLTVSSTHSGSFIEEQSGAYTITVNNIGPGPTVGTVTVTDTLPAGLQALSMSGSGWTCNTSTVSCTRSSVLASNASYPAITLTVLVGSAPPSLTNTAQVSGGGELNTTNDTATDPTTIIQTVQVTVTTSPANLIVTVDGSAVSGPHTYTWYVGQQHTIATSTPQASLNFQNWSDGGAISHNITVSSSTATYTATFH